MFLQPLSFWGDVDEFRWRRTFLFRKMAQNLVLTSMFVCFLVWFCSCCRWPFCFDYQTWLFQSKQSCWNSARNLFISHLPWRRLILSHFWLTMAKRWYQRQTLRDKLINNPKNGKRRKLKAKHILRQIWRIIVVTWLIS